MGTPKEEQRGVVRFLIAEGISQQEISCCMTAVYGEHCILLATVKRWSKQFREGRESCKDNPRPGQSHLHDAPSSIKPCMEEDLSPCDFHIFKKLKKHLKGSRFVKESVTDYLNQQLKEFYETGNTRLVCQWDKYLNVHGDKF